MGGMDKHTSLPRRNIDYDGKEVYSIDPICSFLTGTDSKLGPMLLNFFRQ